MSSWVNILDLAYPVGSVYITTSTTSPASTLGGTWSIIDKKFLYSTSDIPKQTGGSDTHRHQFWLHWTMYHSLFVRGYNADENSILESLSNDGTSFEDELYTETSSFDHLGNQGIIDGTRYCSHPIKVYRKCRTTDTTVYPPYYTVRMWTRTA